ncbi:MAG TPA: DUF1206 domain-containing protein [Thermoanaerobaculia bacterium]|jgi:hypothetical protein
MSNVVSHAKAEAAPWIERLARLGYAAVGVVYAVVGILAIAAAFGKRGRTGDQRAAFTTILEQPFGRVLLGVVALGLVGYALWRYVAGINDSEHRGSDAKGWALRLGSIGRGILYTVIAIEVIRMVLNGGGGSGGGNDQQARHWTAALMDKPFGRWLLGAVGLGVIAYGLGQLLNAWKAKLSKQLRLGPMQESMRRKIIAVSRFGIGARGVVFTLVGGSLLIAAIRHNPSQAQGTSGALQQLAEPAGGMLLALVGLGLVAYGVYGFINARWRMIHPG